MEQIHPIQDTPFPPLPRAPLRFKGVFGVAWTLYRRSFRGLFPLCLLLLLLPQIIIALAQTHISEAISDLSVFDNYYRNDLSAMFNSIRAFLSYGLVSRLIGMLYTFLAVPALNGAMYMEMDQCMEGRHGTSGQLLRYAVPIGFKQYYTTFLAQYAVQIGAGIVFGILFYIAILLLLIPTVILTTLSGAQNIPVAVIVVGILLTLLFVAVLVVACSLFSMAHPIAVREQKRAFSALGHSIRLAWHRLGRVIAVMLLTTLCFMLIIAIVVTPIILYALQDSPPVYFARLEAISSYTVQISIAMALLITFFQPYIAALHTALYIDTASRPLPEKKRPETTESVYGRQPHAPENAQNAEAAAFVPNSAYGQPYDADSPSPQADSSPLAAKPYAAYGRPYGQQYPPRSPRQPEAPSDRQLSMPEAPAPGASTPEASMPGASMPGASMPGATATQPPAHDEQ